MITEVLGFLNKEALYHNIEIKLELQSDLPTIISDRGQLQQIFLNIINNAIDAIVKDGELRIVTSKKSAEKLQVDIIDNGPGMQPEILDNIFEPFFSTKTGKEALGAGWGFQSPTAWSKNWAGTSLWKAPSAKVPLLLLFFQYVLSTKERLPMNKIKVLIVDDEMEFASPLSERLNLRNFESQAVACAEDAMSLLRADWRPDVVLLDLKMPGLDGLDALSVFKQFDPNMEIIILTGHGSTASGIEGMRRGLFDYLMKPVEIDSLVQRVKAAAEKKRLAGGHS